MMILRSFRSTTKPRPTTRSSHRHLECLRPPAVAPKYQYSIRSPLPHRMSWKGHELIISL